MNSISLDMNFSTCLSTCPAILMEGALGERLKREFRLQIDGMVAMADLVDQENGRAALKALWNEYIAIARKYHLPFMATTPTRRANKERLERAGYDEEIILRNVEFLSGIRKSAGIDIYIGGLLGCRGDAYTGEGALEVSEACDFHRWQVEGFKKAGVDFLFAGIMPALPEAVGMAMVMAGSGVPYIISFTIRADGKLIDGHTIDEAICFIDRHVSPKPVCYMTNCVHPDIVYKALSQDFNQSEAVHTRFVGIQANTSRLSYEELDHAEDLKTSSPEDLADAMMRLKVDKHLKIFGGCCGTDGRHMEEIARRLVD